MQWKRLCACLFSGSGKQCAARTVGLARHHESILTSINLGAPWADVFVLLEARPWRVDL